MDADRNNQRVVVIRLPANFQGQANLPTNATKGTGPTVADINQIPDDIIAQMVSHQFQSEPVNINTNDDNGINPNIMIDNSDEKQMAMYSIDHPGMVPGVNSNQSAGDGSTQSAYDSHQGHDSGMNAYSNAIHSTRANEKDDNESLDNTTEPNGQPRSKEDDTVQYKNYSPKQREWMLVVLSYSRGLLDKPFEMKLQDVVIEKSREVLKKNAPLFKMNDRIPTPKTLRSVWKNLWKHPDRTVGTVKKGGRPRIDPAIKRQKRNEREKKRRAALRESKLAGESSSDFYQMESATPRRSQRGQQ